MKNTYLNINNKEDLISDVVLKKLTIHEDESGVLFETLRSDWQEVIGEKAPFAMQYMSITPPKIARDEDQWHVHKNQKDRFICVSGRIVTALFDPRDNSLTKGKLNLFIQSPDKEEEMYMVLIPQDVYHGFMVISQKPAYLLNFPTHLYTPEDEGRAENRELSWQTIRDDFPK